MRIHYLQHVSFEGPGYIEEYAVINNHTLSSTKLFDDEQLPPLDNFDALVIMGGPMGVYDENKYSWLENEKQFIRRTIESNKPVLGICLGAQLIAEVLGAAVYPGPQKEIGWHPLKKADDSQSPLAEVFSEEQTVFHWHGDTFDIPEKGIRLAESAGCRNQAFIYNDKVVGLQFHIEVTEKSVAELVKNCGSECIKEQFIQSPEEILSTTKTHYTRVNSLLTKLLDILLIK